MLDKIYSEAIDNLLSNIPVWQIPVYKFIDAKTGKTIKIDVEEWPSYCMFDEDGDYICPTGFYLKTTWDGDEYHPEDFQKIFTKEQVKEEVLDVAKSNYPDVYNEIVNNLS